MSRKHQVSHPNLGRVAPQRPTPDDARPPYPHVAPDVIARPDQFVAPRLGLTRAAATGASMIDTEDPLFGAGLTASEQGFCVEAMGIEPTNLLHAMQICACPVRSFWFACDVACGVLSTRLPLHCKGFAALPVPPRPASSIARRPVDRANTEGLRLRCWLRRYLLPYRKGTSFGIVTLLRESERNWPLAAATSVPATNSLTHVL